MKFEPSIDFDKTDYQLFEQIESIREWIVRQDINIDFIDYGAGSPTFNRTDKEMYNGVASKTSTQSLCKIGIKGDFAHYLYALIKKHKPKKILELGTCCGFSSMYMAKACEQFGIVHTIEGSEQIAEIARKNLSKAGSNNVIQYIGRFQDILPDVLNKITKFDFVLIDGHHDKDATIRYFNQIKPYLSSLSIVIFDDIHWSKGMSQAWDLIKSDDAIKNYIDLNKLAVCYLNQ